MDAHLDLAMNAMEWNRDLKQPVAQLREREKGLTDKPDRERNVVSCFWLIGITMGRMPIHLGINRSRRIPTP